MYRRIIDTVLSGALVMATAILLKQHHIIVVNIPLLRFFSQLVGWINNTRYVFCFFNELLVCNGDYRLILLQQKIAMHAIVHIGFWIILPFSSSKLTEERYFLRWGISTINPIVLLPEISVWCFNHQKEFYFAALNTDLRFALIGLPFSSRRWGILFWKLIWTARSYLPY